MRAALICAVVLSFAATTGCGRLRGIQSKSAVQAAIEAHLKQRPNILPSNMTLDVQEVKFGGDRAEAQVVYRSKESPELAVRIRYVLRRAGNHWKVESSSPAGGMGAKSHSSSGPIIAPSAEATAPQPSH